MRTCKLRGLKAVAYVSPHALAISCRWLGFFIIDRRSAGNLSKEMRFNMSAVRSRSFKQGGFTYVNPRDGFVYKLMGDHAHDEVIQLIKTGKIPVAYLREQIPKGNHDSRECIISAFEDEDSPCPKCNGSGTDGCGNDTVNEACELCGGGGSMKHVRLQEASDEFLQFEKPVYIPGEV